jgi:hypothetical protein
MSRGYIVPTDLLTSLPPRGEWHATPIPADPTRSFVVVEWDNPNEESAFERRPEILPLGNPWEPLPAEAIPLLASFQVAINTGATLPSTDTPAGPDSVATALRKVPWPGARLVR